MRVPLRGLQRFYKDLGLEHRIDKDSIILCLGLQTPSTELA